MDNRIVMAGLGLLALVGVGAAAMMMGGDTAPDTVETPTKGAKAKKGKKAAQVDLLGDDEPAPEGAADGGEPGDGTMKVADNVEHDEGYEERAEMHKQRRLERNKAWHETTMATTRKWVVDQGLDEATGLEVQNIMQRTYDVVGQTKEDMGNGVIPPREGRDEIQWAQEERRIQLVNLVGEEKADALLNAVKTAIATGN